MKTIQNRRKRDKYIKWLSYTLVSLSMATFHYLTDDKPFKDSQRYYTQSFSKGAGTLAEDYYMPDNEVCLMLIVELKTSGPDFQVYHLVD